jgi:hypothetical protein
MPTDPINANAQMQQLAGNAVAHARDNYGVNLDYSENSLHHLEQLLQSAHGVYTSSSSSDNSHKVFIEKIVQLWGSYLGEVIRRGWGGIWIEVDHETFLQLETQRLDPLGQVRSRIMAGDQHNVHEYYDTLSKTLKQLSPHPQSTAFVQPPSRGNETGFQVVKAPGKSCPDCGSDLQGRDVARCPYCDASLVDLSPADQTGEQDPDRKTDRVAPAATLHATEDFLKKQQEESQTRELEEEQERQQAEKKRKKKASRDRVGCLIILIILVCVFMAFISNGRM